jgi:polar amino acid transport system substrate-binding protein
MHTLLHVALAVSLVMPAAATFADTLDEIQKRGVLRWGGDDAGGGPYIYTDDSQKIVGFEVELADYLAKSLGVRSEYVYCEWDMLPHSLEIGNIDLVLNGYEWSEERQQLYGLTMPYYIYKLQLMARASDNTIRTWEDLRRKQGERRKRVGVLQSSAAERYARKRFGDSIELRTYPEVTSVLGLVEDEQLDATIQDLPIAVFYGPQYQGLRSIDNPAEPGYYIGLVPPKDKRLQEKLNAAILQAINDGTLRRIYEKYGVWNDDQNRLAEVAKFWPPKIAAPESRWAHLPEYAGILLLAAWTTLKLSFLAMPLAIVIGILVAVGRLYGPAWIRLPLGVYVEILRGTPLLLQLFIICYMLPKYTDFKLPDFWAGVLGLAINYSAYEAENYRAGLLAIPRGQMEAALSLGMNMSNALRRILVPQAVRIVIPPVTNDFIALFKDTSVVSMISVVELTLRYRSLSSDHPQLILELAAITAFLYLVMSYPLSLVARRMEMRLKEVNR